MSIERLIEIRGELNHHKFLMSSYNIESILDCLIPILKDLIQEQQNIYKQLAQKEDVITLSEIKEARNINGS